MLFGFGGMSSIRREVTGREKLEELCSPFFGCERDAGERKNDHGERTNQKLNDQPYYHRGKKKKMRGY